MRPNTPFLKFCSRGLFAPARFGWLIFALLAAPAAHAMTVVPPGFERLVSEAAQILRIEVTGVTCRRDEVGARRVLHTYVEARVLRTLKGEEAPTVTLRFFGGRIGNDFVHVPDMPTLEVGSRYVVFLKDNGTAFCPLLGVMHGSYLVQHDEATGVDYLRRSNGELLRQTQDLVRPLAAESAGPRAASVAGGMTLGEFESSILNQLSHAAR